MRTARAAVTRYRFPPLMTPHSVASLHTEDGNYASGHIAAHGREWIRTYFQRGVNAWGRRLIICPPHLRFHLLSGLVLALHPFEEIFAHLAFLEPVDAVREGVRLIHVLGSWPAFASPPTKS